MGLYTSFKNAYFDIMTRHGFIYQKKVFIRVLGGDIVQIIGISQRKTHEITATIFPLAAPPIVLGLRSRDFADSIAFSYWTDNYVLTFNHLKNLPNSISFLSDGREVRMVLPSNSKNGYSEEYLKATAQGMEEYYIPLMDSIKNMDSYVSWYVSDQKPKDFRNGMYRLSEEELLYKCYLDQNFDFAIDHLKWICQKNRVQDEKNLRDAMQATNPLIRAQLPQSIEERIAENMRDFEERIYRGSYKLFWKYFEENNITELSHFVEERIEHNKCVLLNEFSKLMI